MFESLAVRIYVLYCRPPEFTVTQPGKYLAGGLQSGHTVNLIGVQYKLWRQKDGYRIGMGEQKL